MLTSGGQNAYLVRQERLRARLEERKLTFLVVTTPCNVFYLTGFRGSAGVAVFGASEAMLWVDPRYTLQARTDAQGVKVFEEKKPLLSAAARWLSRKRVSAAGYEDDNLSHRDFRAFERAVRRGLRLVPAGGIVEDLRIIKDEDEIERIREAGRITVDVLEEVLSQIRVGARESDLAAEIEYRMRRKGAEGAAFETIVASGPRAAYPHARASNKELRKGELVIFDLGAILDGYAADMTRTFYLGKPSGGTVRLYKAVLEAQQRAVEALRPGVRASAVDLAARRALERRRLAKYFTHSTGHGVGLHIHEKPRLARKEKARLEAGSVVTAEPGIYMEGLGGIRLEDTVLVTECGHEVLTPAPMDNWIIS
jgi:Xaa-Pro aminopeptidase